MSSGCQPNRSARSCASSYVGLFQWIQVRPSPWTSVIRGRASVSVEATVVRARRGPMRGRLGIGTERVSGCRLRHTTSVLSSQENLSYVGSNGNVRGGSEANERLTATAGAVLFLLLAAEGVTILSIRPLLSAHVFIGMLLVPPVALKLATTGWRFARYYRGSPEYRRKGPPLLPLRLLAPVVVVSTVALFATGITLLLVGPGAGLVLL